MPRHLHRLSARAAATLTEPGRHADGGGLYLSVSKDGARRWVFLYSHAGKRRELGLGGAKVVSLKDARDRADEARKLVFDGVDPIVRRAEAKKPQKAITFADCAAGYIKDHADGWRNPKHRQQWTNTLTTHAYPHIGNMPVDQIDIHDIKKVLEPIWKTKTETASRVRGRMEAILDWATTHGYRDAANPARWRGYLANVMPSPRKLAKVRHYPALPYQELPAFMAELKQREGVAARALEFAILTAARTGEVIGASWPEIDIANGVFSVPAERMKAGVPWRTALVPETLDILTALSPKTPFVFPGLDVDRPLSNMSLLAVLHRMGRDDLTVHGFRSTFRDWAAETTDTPNEVVEMALAHTIKNKAEAAYRRGDLLDRRRALLEKWAVYALSGTHKDDNDDRC